MFVSLIVDCVLIGLLIATMSYCLRLNNRLESIRGADQELQKLLGAFNVTTETARQGISELRALSETRGRALDEAIVKAQKLADELSIMTDSGNRLADRLDKGFSNRQAGEENTPEADHDLLRALRRVK